MAQPDPTALVAQRDHGFAGLVGLGRADVTPSLEVFARCWGAGKADRMDRVHRPLTATALAVAGEDDPSQPLILVALDGSWWQADDERPFREDLLRRFSLKEPQLLVSLSHSHAAPPLNAGLADKPGGEELAAYIHRLPALIEPAIATALDSLQAGFITAHYGRCDLARHRDLYPGPSSRPLVGLDPATPADDTLLALRVLDRSGRLLAVGANYACHLTTLGIENTQLSPDLAGAFRETVEAVCPGALAFFLQGASGELAPSYQYHGDAATADAYGRKLAYATLATLADASAQPSQLCLRETIPSGADLAMWRPEAIDLDRSLDFDLRSFTLPLKAALPTRAELLARFTAASDPAQRERLQRQLARRSLFRDDHTFQAGLWLWRLGDIVLAAAPFEAYSVWQRETRNRFSPTPLAVMNLVNGSPGYLPPANAYDDPRLYTVWQTPFARGGLEKVTRETIQGIAELKKP